MGVKSTQVLPLAHMHTITMNIVVATMRRMPVMAPTITGKVKRLSLEPPVVGCPIVVDVKGGDEGPSVRPQIVVRAEMLTQ